ncbi:MAG: hypothetical protein Fur0028_11240 [Bacteroidales bacterium]
MHGQHDKVIRTFINGYEYKKAQLKTDSHFIHSDFIKSYCEMVMTRANDVLCLDSVKNNSNGSSFYFHLLPKYTFLVLLKDSVNNSIEKQVFTTHYYSKINRLLDKYITQMENSGFPFAEIVLDSVYKTAKDSLTLSYRLFKNVPVVYDSIDVIGKPMVSKKFLAAYTGIVAGNRYNERNIKHFDRLMNDLMFIRQQKKSDLFFIDSKAKLRVYIEKQSANNFSGLIGIANGTNNQIQFTGDVTINLKNIFKHADMCDISWEKIGEQSQRLDLLFSYPYLFNIAVGASTRFNLYKQDSTFLNSQFKVGLMFYTQGFNGMLVYYEQRQTSVLKYTTSGLAATNCQFAGLNFINNSFNKPILSDKGYSLSIDAAYGQRTLFKSPQIPDSVYDKLSKKIEQWRGNATFISFIPLTKSFFIKFKAEGGIISPGQFKNELFRLGGSQSIRGFDEESIYASSYLLASGEFRVSLDNATQLFAFYDKLIYRSYIYTDNPWGIGVGAELNTGAGVFFISYALGSQFNQSLAFRNSKIHFGYKNRF